MIRTGSGMCSYEMKRREFFPSSPYRARSTSSPSIEVGMMQLLMMLPRASRLYGLPAHGSNTDSATVAWHILIDSTEYRPMLSSGCPLPPIECS